MLWVWPIAAKPVIKPGVSRWPIKTSLAPGADLAHPKTIAFGDLITLADPPGVTRNDPRYQSSLIPPFTNSLGVTEGEIVSTTGWLHLVAGENDGDFHIQISGSRKSGNHCLIVEVPKADAAFVADASLRAQCAAVGKFILDQILHGKAPSESGRIVKPVYVKVTGQLFYDDAHVGQPPRGKKKMKAATLWEVHPVIDVQFAQPPQP